LYVFKINTIRNFSYYYRIFRSSYLIKNISKVYTGDILSKVIGVGTAVLLIRGLAIGDYAAYTAFSVIVGLAPGLVGNGINRALVRFSAEHISKTGDRSYELYFIGLIFQLVLYSSLSIALFMVANKVTPLFFGQKAFSSSLCYGLIAGLGVLITQVGRSIYQAEERFGHYIKTLWLRQILAFALILLLFFLKQLNFRCAARAMIIVELTVASIVLLHIFRKFCLSHALVAFKGQSDIVKDFISSTGWLIAYAFALTSFQRLDIFMLSHFSTIKELANYGVAFRYYYLALLLLGSIHAVLLPKFSRVDMQASTRQHQFVIKWLKATVWLIIPIALADFFGKSLFIWITGSQYEKAYYIFIVLSVGVWLSLMFSPLVNILMSRKRFKFLFALAICALVLNFNGNYFLIPVMGGFGAAIATVASHLLINGSATAYIMVKR